MECRSLAGGLRQGIQRRQCKNTWRRDKNSGRIKRSIQVSSEGKDSEMVQEKKIQKDHIVENIFPMKTDLRDNFSNIVEF